MKANLLKLATALALLIPTAALAQAVPNGTFETWVSRTGLEVPQSWTTVDEGIKGSPFGGAYTTVTTSKDADSRTGALAAKMESKSNVFLSPSFGIIPGGVLLGSASYTDILNIIRTRDISSVGGLPFTTRAANMQFYYKLTGPEALADSAYAIVTLTRTVGSNVQTIATGALRILPVATYTSATVPLTYSSSATPDAIHVAFVSGIAAVRHTGTILFVDDAVMTGTVASTQNPALAAALTVYPNPSASGEFQLASPSRPSVATAPYSVTDATGRVVRTAAAAPTSLASGRALELQGLPAGVYLLHLNTPEGLLTRKLMLP